MTTAAERVKELRRYQATGRDVFFKYLRIANARVAGRIREMARNPGNGQAPYQSRWQAYVAAAYGMLGQKLDEWGEDMVVRVSREARARAAGDIKAQTEAADAQG